MRNIEFILFCIVFLHWNLMGQKLAPDGGGEYPFTQNAKCLSDSQRELVKEEIAISRKHLMEKGILNAPNGQESVSFDWPLQKANGLTYNNYFGISGYVDQDIGSGKQDYKCGSRTYNGHHGTDYFTWPFPWYLYENNFVEVVAAHEGTIVYKQDGKDDKHCSWMGNWNAIYVEHADGSVAWYGHMKKNGLTTKGVGQHVDKGEFLGVVASSGWSTGPHLHFEVYDKNNKLIDPYAGNCNSLNTSSWWVNQPAYRTPKINAVLTHSASPEIGCPDTDEAPHLSDIFYAGDDIVFGAYFQDQLIGDSPTFRIRRPNLSIWESWNKNFNTTYSASYWYWTKKLPNNGPFGHWTFEVIFKGETVSHEFQYLSAPVGINELVEEGKVKIYPNPTTGKILFSGSKVHHVMMQNYLGQIVFDMSLNNQEVDMSNWPSGVYFVFLKLDDEVVAKRIFKE